MIESWLRRRLERRPQDMTQLVIDQLRTRVEELEDAFEPIVAMFPEEISTEPGVRHMVGEYLSGELRRARDAIRRQTVRS